MPKFAFRQEKDRRSDSVDGGEGGVGMGGQGPTTHIMGPTPFVLVICFPKPSPNPLLRGWMKDT